MKRGTRRSLLLEGLEARQCFSSDVGVLFSSLEVPEKVAEMLRHNFEQPTDVNVDGHTSPLDALNVINELNFKDTSINSAMMSDTNGDKVVSPLDALIVINHLNLRSGTAQEPNEKATAEIVESDSMQTESLIKKIVLDSQSAREPAELMLRRLGDAGLVDLGAIDLGSLKFKLLDGSSKTAADLSTVASTELDAGSVVRAMLARTGAASSNPGLTYDPTDDNGNGYFLSSEEATPISSPIEAELRRQLKLDDSAAIQVAVFTGGDEIRSGTWVYVNEEGFKIWGNWRQAPDELRLFLSNVEEENRFYGQYPGGSLVFFSWLDAQPVNFYFTPIDKGAVENPVPLEQYTAYFGLLDGVEATGHEQGEIDAFSGDFNVFDGVQPMEKLLSDLYAFQRQWDAAIG